MRRLRPAPGRLTDFREGGFVVLWTLRLVTLAIMWGLVVIAFPVYFVLAGGAGAAGLVDDSAASASSATEVFAAPPLWLVAVQLGLGLTVHLVIEAMGYRVDLHRAGRGSSSAASPDPAAPSTSTALAIFRDLTQLRLALGLAVAILSVAGAVVLVVPERAFLTYVIGAAISVVLVSVHAYPWNRPIDKTAAGLERARLCTSASSDASLRSMLGLAGDR